MRFSAAIVVASGASAYAAAAPTPIESTATVVNTVSVIDCGPDVTDCPGKTSYPTEAATTEEAEEPMTTSTVYEEHLKTITDCGPEVVDCPAHSTIIVTESVAVSTTVCPVGETTHTSQPPVVVPPPAETPAVPEHPAQPPTEGGDNSPVCPGGEHCPEQPAETPAVPAHPSQPPTEGGENSPEQPECVPSYTVTHITKEHVTTVTTVETATVPVPCPGEETPSVPTGGVSSVVPPPAESTPIEGGNPPPPAQTPPTAGAAGLTASAAFAAVAGLFALLA